MKKRRKSAIAAGVVVSSLGFPSLAAGQTPAPLPEPALQSPQREPDEQSPQREPDEQSPQREPDEQSPQREPDEQSPQREPDEQSPLRIGFNVGTGVSTLWGPDRYEAGLRAGFNAGVSALIPSSGILSFQPELHYTMMGFKAYGATVKLNYLTMPLLARIRLSSSAPNPFFVFGPQLGFKIHEEISYSYGSYTYSYAGDYFDDLDVGIAAGFGLTIPNTGDKFTLQLRSYIGLSNVVEDTRARNFNFGLFGSYWF